MVKSKIFYLIVFLLNLLLFVSCNYVNEETKNETKLDVNSTDETSANDVQMNVSVSKENLSKLNLSKEEIIAKATNIVCAKYVEATKRGIYTDLLFETTEQIKGNIEESLFVVTVDESNSALRYEKGTEYILVLEKHVSVYLEQDIYLPLRNILEKDEEGINYENICLLVENDNGESENLSVGIDYIRSSDIEDIVEQTEQIYRVKVTEFVGGSENNNTERFNCAVVDELKGNAYSEIIEIIFSSDTVEIGKEYIVMLNKGEHSLFYSLSSKNSVFSVEDEENVRKIKELVD